MTSSRARRPQERDVFTRQPAEARHISAYGMLAKPALRLVYVAATVVCRLVASSKLPWYGISIKRMPSDSQNDAATLASIGFSSVVRPSPATRGLEIDQDECGVYGMPSEFIVAATENRELPLGTSVTKILTGPSRAGGNGGNGGTWYEETLSSLLVEYCAETQQSVHHRYVTSENMTAVKDEDGICVRIPDGDPDAYTAGLCERFANCYWEEPRRDAERRGRRYTDQRYNADDSAARDYVQSIVLHFGMFGIVLAIAVFVGGLKFAVSRGIFNKCVCDGDLQRDRLGYTDMEQKLPAVIFVMGLTTAVVGGVLGLQANASTTMGIDGMFTTMEEAAAGIDEFASNVSSPLNSLINSLDTSMEQVELLLSNTEQWVGELEDGMVLRHDAFDDAHRHRLTGRGEEFDALVARVEAVSADFVSAVADLIAAMSVLKHQFIGTKEVMEGQSGNVIAALSMTNACYNENLDRLAYFRGLSYDFVERRSQAIRFIAAAVAGGGAVGLLGIAAGLANNKACSQCINMIGVTCIIAFATTWTAFLFSSFFIVGSIIWSDACHFLELAATKGWDIAGLDGQSAMVMDGCFNGQSVANELNLTEALGFFDSYAVIADEIGSANTTPARVAVEDAIYDVSNFIDSLNSTALAVTLLDVYTNRVEVNSSQLLDPHCPYNVTFDGEAMEYLGRPWLALPTVEAATAAVVGAVGTADGEDNNGNLEASTFSSGSSSLTNETTLTAITYAKTSWEAGGAHQSFGRHEGETALTYMSRIFNASHCGSINDDLISAWDSAARERAMREQMKDDLTCINAAIALGGIFHASVVEGCSASRNSTTSNSYGSSTSMHSSSSSSLSPCTCTSDDYTAPDTALSYFRTFSENATDLRSTLAGLIGSDPATESGRGILAGQWENAMSARCASRCSFLPSHFFNFYGAMCDTALGGLGQTGVSMFLIGLGGLAMAVTSAIMVHRLKAPWAKNMAKVLSTEEGIVMEEY